MLVAWVSSGGALSKREKKANRRAEEEVRDTQVSEGVCGGQNPCTVHPLRASHERARAGGQGASSPPPCPPAAAQRGAALQGRAARSALGGEQALQLVLLLLRLGRLLRLLLLLLAAVHVDADVLRQ